MWARYRDLNQVWEVLVHAGFFVAPIVYPLHILPERFHIYLYLWPPTPFVQYVRSFTQPIMQIANISNVFQQTAASAERAVVEPAAVVGSVVMAKKRI